MDIRDNIETHRKNAMKYDWTGHRTRRLFILRVTAAMLAIFMLAAIPLLRFY